MKVLFTSVLCFCILLINAQESQNTTWENGKPKDVYSSVGKNIIRYTYYNPDGIKMADGSYRQGRKHGPWHIYYPSGTLKGRFYFYKGAEDGKQIFYLETGEKEAEYTYKQGKKEGEYILYYPNAKPKEKGQYAIIPFRSYLPAPPPQSDSLLLHLPGMASVKSGKITQYYESGKIKVIQYFDSQYDILVNHESKENNILFRLQNKEIPTGIWTYFDENGKISLQEIYKQGQLSDRIETVSP